MLYLSSCQGYFFSLKGLSIVSLVKYGNRKIEWIFVSMLLRYYPQLGNNWPLIRRFS